MCECIRVHVFFSVKNEKSPYDQTSMNADKTEESL